MCQLPRSNRSRHQFIPSSPVVDFAGSEVFDRLFRDGMGLVEEAAAYLDGPGRTESRKLSRELRFDGKLTAGPIDWSGS